MRTDVRTVPPAEDVEHAGDVLVRRRWVQFVRRPVSMIWRIGRGRRKVVIWCQAAERNRHIFEETCDGNMLSRAPELRIGLVNDIMCGLI